MEIAPLEQGLAGRILVVDDEEIVRRMLTEGLEQAGHTVVAVEDAESGLREVESGEFDLVLSDLHLPTLSGVELLVRVRAVRPGLPVIVLTGAPALDKAVDAMKKGAADFIAKPFSIDHIDHVVRKNLQERRLYSENQRLLAELNNKAVIEKLNRQLSQKVGLLTKLYRISESFHSYVDNRSLLQYVVDLASELTGAQRVSLLTFDTSKRYMVMRASKGISSKVQHEACLKVGEGVAGRVAREHRPVRVVAAEGTGGAPAGPQRHYDSQSWLSVPLFIGGELFGVLNLTDKADHSDFTEEDEHLALALAEKAGIKVENNVLYDGIYANLLDTLKALVSTIEAKDAYTHHHSQRVTDIALTLARELGCSEEDCESLAFAGILHDIGKIGIQDSILQKPSALTPEEFEIMKRHPVLGEEIVAPLGLVEAGRHIIRHHHERYDGYGYPDGLSGDDIPFPAHIISIADTFDAMTSTRSYRRALALPWVIEELRRNSGSQFNPIVVNALVQAVEDGKIGPCGDLSHPAPQQAEMVGRLKPPWGVVSEALERPATAWRDGLSRRMPEQAHERAEPVSLP